MVELTKRIVVAGASGVIGRSLLPLLRDAGHEVTALVRNREYAEQLNRQGFRTVEADAYDREILFAAIGESHPEVVIHQLTALGGLNFSDNARIRVEGTRNLVDASIAAGVRKMIAQSISWVQEDGDGPAEENEKLDLGSPEPRRTTVEGVHALESAVAEMPEHVVLRYGLLYGAGTWYAADGRMADQARRGELIATDGVSSFVHVEDAARAALLALDWPSGIYNVVDDEPAAGTEWVPVYAAALNAPEPLAEQRSGRGERGALNEKAVRHGWKPRYTSWREGFLRTLSGE